MIRSSMNSMIKYPDFFIIPRLVALDKKIQDQDKMVYGAVYWLENLKDGKCTASNHSIAEIIGSTNSLAIANSLLRLENQGYIKRIFSDSKNRTRLEIKSLVKFGKVSSDSDTYHQPMIPLSSSGDTPLSSDDEQNKNIINKKREEEHTPPAQTPEATEKGWKNDPHFKEFWAAYPRKVAPAAAWRAWKKIKTPASLLPRILSSLKEHSASEQWRLEHGRFIPHPASFLNQERWEDEVKTTAPRRIIKI